MKRSAEEHIVKGYEVAKGRYVVVDPDELEPFMPAATKTIELEEFVDLDQIDPVYFDTAYYVAPDANAKPYALLAQAMEASGKVGIGRYVMRNKQYTAAIRAEEGRMVMSSLAYADEVVDPLEIEELAALDEVEVSDKEVLMAESLVESLSADFEPEKYHDEYREQVMTLIEMKADGEEITTPMVETEAPKVIDIMAALEASVAAAKASRDHHPAAKAAAKLASVRSSRRTTKANRRPRRHREEAGCEEGRRQEGARRRRSRRPRSRQPRSGPPKKSAAKKSAAKKSA